MQYAGILVLVRPDAWEEASFALGALEGVDVHHREEATGRVVVVAETDDVGGQERVLAALRAVPGVVVAEPVYHYRPEDASGTAGAMEDREEDAS